MSDFRVLPPDFQQRCDAYRAALERFYASGTIDHTRRWRLERERQRIGLAEEDARDIEEEYLGVNGAKLLEQMQTRLNSAQARIQELEGSLAQASTRIRVQERLQARAEARIREQEELRARAEARIREQEELLARAEARIREQEKLLAQFEQLPRHFPWSDSLLVAKRVGNRLELDHFDLLSPNSQAGTPGRFFGQCLTYLAPNETTMQAIIVRSANQQRNQEVVIAAELEVIRQPVTIQYEVRFPQGKPELITNGARLIRYLSPTKVTLPEPLPRLVERNAPLDMAFLLDGSMARADFERAREFIVRIIDTLAQEKMVVRLACVLYGEYFHTFPDKRTWNSDLEVEVQPFCSPAEFEQFLSTVKPLTPFEHDYCDALELGLQKVKELQWSANVQHLLLIGNSPPHPTNSERRKYNLYDRTTDEFYNINWSNELEVLKKQGHLYLSSVWVEPTEGPPTRSQRRFAESVWRTLGQDCYLHNPDDKSHRYFENVIQRSAQKWLSVERVLQLPLLKPLSLDQ